MKGVENIFKFNILLLSVKWREEAVGKIPLNRIA